jgi:hypothetical protein
MSLQTPWLRDQLRSHLLDLANATWLQTAVNREGRPDDAHDAVLDFLDDTGVADEPVGRIGYILRDQREADAMKRLGRALDDALASRGKNHWQSVSEAARQAIDALS